MLLSHSRVELSRKRKAKALAKPRFCSQRKRLFTTFILGQGLATWWVSLESLWAWIVNVSTVHARDFAYKPRCDWDGLMARNRPQLLPEKLRLIREHLQLDHAHMAEQLVSEIESHSHKRIQIKTHWIRNFELGRHEPDLVVVNTYGRLAKVSMESIVDDTVSAEAFRKRLGKNSSTNRKWSNFQRKGNGMTLKLLALIVSLIGQFSEFVESPSVIPRSVKIQ